MGFRPKALNIAKNLALSPTKSTGLPRRLGNAIKSTGRELFGVFKDSAYTVKDLLTGSSPERVGPLKRTGNIAKGRGKVLFGDPRKDKQTDFAHEKEKTKELHGKMKEATSAIASLPEKTRKVIKEKASDIASLFLGSGKPAAIS